MNLQYCRNHQHPCCETIIQYGGQYNIIIEKKVFQMSKGSILLIPPYIEHKTEADNEFSDMYIQTDTFPFKVSAPLLINDSGANILRLCKTLYSVKIKDDVNYKIISEGLIQVIFDLIQAIAKEKFAFTFTSELKNEIEENFSDSGFSILKCEKKFAYNPDYIRYGFKSDIGVTPSEYLKNLRIKCAKKLLVQTKFKSIKEIAYECGFDDQHYFSRIFKKETGVSPRNYRDNR